MNLARHAPAAEWIAIGVLAGVWWLLRLHGLGYSVSDEYIYFYAAKEWAGGVWPYRDFFFSHPPLQIAVPAVLFKFFGFHHLLAKLIAPTATFLSGLVLWRGSRCHFGRVAGVSTYALFLFGAEVLRSSMMFLGVELTTLFLSLGIIAALDRRSIRAGIWFAIAACTGFYGVAGFLTFFVLSLAAPPRSEGTRWDAERMAAGFIAVFGAINALFFAVGGSRFLDGVYRYHFLKAAKNSEQHPLSEGPQALLQNLALFLDSRDFQMTLYFHSTHYCLAALALVLILLPGTDRLSWSPRGWWPGRPGGINQRGAVILVALSALGTLTELASLQERYDFYFVLVMPALSLIGGYAIGRTVELASVTKKPAVPRWLAPTLFVAALGASIPVAKWANRTAWPEEIAAIGSSKGAGEVLHFDWSPSPVLPELGEFAHLLFWGDSRVRGEIHSGIEHYLWSTKHYFSTAPDMAAYVREHTSDRDTITGASDYAPLIALLSGRRLAGNQVDTNRKVFATGVVTEDAYWTSVCADQPAYLLAAEGGAFAPSVMEHTRAAAIFRQAKTFDDPHIKNWRTTPIQLWRRIREPPASICESD